MLALALKVRLLIANTKYEGFIQMVRDTARLSASASDPQDRLIVVLSVKNRSRWNSG